MRDRRPRHPLRLAVRIQAHPSRAEYAERLRRQLHDKHARIVYDPDPDGPRNPWRTARACWESVPKQATHALVVQEDVIPCQGFLTHARRALEARPDRVTSFFLGWLPAPTAQAMLVASTRCAAWVRGHPGVFVPALALAMPRWLVDDLLAFDAGTAPVADDAVYARFLDEKRIPWYATIPSLVDHDDDAPSLMSMTGRDRRAACFVGVEDASLIDWDRE